MPCVCEKQSFLDSYSLEVHEARRLQPELSEHDTRVQVAQKFRPKYYLLREAERVESSGALVYENGEFTLTPEGKIYYPKYGSTAEALHGNQFKQTPEKYSPTDHQTTLLIQQAFADGASVVRTSYAREGEDNRDILEFRYDRVTRKGVIKVYNLAADGKLHSLTKIRELANDKLPQLNDVSPSHNVFIQTDVDLPAERAKQAVAKIGREVTPIQISDQPHREDIRYRERSTPPEAMDGSHSQKIEPIEEIAKMTETIALVSARETKRTAAALTAFVGRELFHRKKLEVDKRRRVVQKNSVPENIKPPVAGSVPAETQPLGEAPKKFERMVRKQAQEARLILRPIVSADPISAEMGTASLGFRKLGREAPRFRRQRHKKTTTWAEKPTRPKSSAETGSQKEGRAVERKQGEGNEKKKTLVRQRERRAGSLEKGKKEERRVLQEIQPKKREKRLSRDLRRLVRRLEREVNRRQRKEVIRRLTPAKQKEKPRESIILRKEKGTREKTMVARAASSWALWMLLEKKRTAAPIPRDASFRSGQKKTDPEPFVTKEPSLWLLLSIIWYLAMIRESRQTGASAARYAKKQAQAPSVPVLKPAHNFPSRGIIFSACS